MRTLNKLGGDGGIGAVLREGFFRYWSAMEGKRCHTVGAVYILKVG